MANVAVVGGGYWGKNIIRELKTLKVLKVICDSNSDILSQHADVETTTDWKSLLDRKDIDKVFVVTPAPMHYALVKSFLEANKDVFVEKPITLNIAEAEELVHLAQERKRILMVGHLLHYHTHVEKMKELVATGAIGKLVSITANRLNLGLIRTQENVLWSFAPHDISVILSLVQDKLPHSVQATGHASLTSKVHDTVNSVMNYKNGPYVNVNVSWLNATKEQKMTVVGEKGILVFDDTVAQDKLLLYKDHVVYKNGLPVANKYAVEVIQVNTTESPLAKECQHFLNCYETRVKPITDGQEALRVLKVLNLLQQSLESKGQKKRMHKKKAYYVHKTATVDAGAEIGTGTKIWHYSHICKDAKIGKNCNIGQNVYIAGGAVLGDHCKVQNNVSIYAGVHAGDYVFFGPSCVLTNDINPRGMHSKNGEYMTTILEDGVTLGANCTVVCGNTLGQHCLVGAGAVITKDVNAHEIVVGNPATCIGTIDEKGNRTLD